MIKTFLLLVGAAIVAGCAQQAASAPAAASTGRECFSARNVSSFKAQGDNAVDVQVGVRRYFRLQLAGVCPNVNWTRRVAVVSRSGSSFICQGFDAELVVIDPGLGPQRCVVNGVRRLSDAEARALKYYK
ncbi:MAG: hypothetical protein HOP96_04175 [Sphingomonas sp.]|nr:hypothetical protein [Sphingomonas sp.]